jgi:hypothetical protein
MSEDGSGRPSSVTPGRPGSAIYPTNPLGEQFGDILPALGMAAARRVGVRQFVHQDQAGPPGQRSVEIYLEMCEGQRSSLADSRTYKEGLQRCIGSSRMSASFHFDLPAIFDQVFGLMDEFGAEIPPETEEVIDQITRIGVLHAGVGVIGDDEVTFTSGVSFPVFDTVGGGVPLSSEMFSILPEHPFLFFSTTFDGPAIFEQIEEKLVSLLTEDVKWKVEQGKKTFQAMIGT